MSKEDLPRPVVSNLYALMRDKDTLRLQRAARAAVSPAAWNRDTPLHFKVNSDETPTIYTYVADQRFCGNAKLKQRGMAQGGI